MKNPMLVLLILSAISLITGCAHKSYHPWLGEELLVNDDRLAGVWQGDLEVSENTETRLDRDIVIIRAITDEPEEGSKEDAVEIPAGYYSITVIKGDSLEEKGTIEKPFVNPQAVVGGLYKVEETYIAQLSGHTIEEQSPLVAPMYVIYKVELNGDELRLYNLSLDGPESDQILLADLIVEEGKDGPHTFFSKTEDLTRFVTKYHTYKSFFDESPRMILKRIRDLREVLMGEDQENDEELVPIPE